MIKTALCLLYLLFSIFPFRLRGPVLLVELHTHCEAPKRGAFTTGKKSRDKYLVLIATVLSLLPPLAFSVSLSHWLWGKRNPGGQSDPKHSRMSTVTVPQLLYCHLYFLPVGIPGITGHQWWSIGHSETALQSFSVSPFLLVCTSHCSPLITKLFDPHTQKTFSS